VCFTGIKLDIFCLEQTGDSAINQSCPFSGVRCHERRISGNPSFYTNNHGGVHVFFAQLFEDHRSFRVLADSADGRCFKSEVCECNGCVRRAASGRVDDRIKLDFAPKRHALPDAGFECFGSDESEFVRDKEYVLDRGADGDDIKHTMT